MNSLTLIALASIAAPIFAVELESKIDRPYQDHTVADLSIAQMTT